MNLEYGRLDLVAREIEKLSSFHRIAFAAACCERLYPNYGIILREMKLRSSSEPNFMRCALDKIWKYLEGEDIDKTMFCRLLSDCEEYPYDYEGIETAETQRAAWIIICTLKLCLEPTVQNLINAIEHVKQTLFEYLDCEMDNNDSNWNNKTSKEQNIIIANHPFTVREIAKENEDLQRLQEASTLTPELLEWLRTSSQNDGKSLIDLS